MISAAAAFTDNMSPKPVSLAAKSKAVIRFHMQLEDQGDVM